MSAGIGLGIEDDELIVDLFAGGGGASTGIERALGRPVDIAVNHSANAIAMHARNHPNAHHYRADVWHVSPLLACAGRRVGLLWLSPACFPAGTLVLTRKGYTPIETIAVGDEVFTHELRWRRVTHTMSTERPLVLVRGHGHAGIRVSAEHPFYTRARADRWKRIYKAPEWTEAGKLRPRDLWASPSEFPAEQAALIAPVRGRTMNVDERLMWLVGRYLADGWLRLSDDRAELTLACGDAKIDALRKHLAVWPRAGERSQSDELAWHERRERTAWQVSTNHRALVTWLRDHFGCGAANKRMPAWVYGLSESMRRALLEGYVSGDGWQSNGLFEVTSVSRALAFGIKTLLATLGVSANVFESRAPSVIEGRTVNVRPSLRVRWRERVDAKHQQTLRDGGIEWAPIREVTHLGGLETVFNLSVEEDESYVVEGLIVHNCTHFSRAKGGQNPKSAKIRSLASVAIRWAREVKPRVIILENVVEFLDWGPLDNDGKPIKAKKGHSFNNWLGKLKKQGYQVEWRQLVAADYGTPTTRKRLFLIARCDGQPIVWPEPSHSKERSLFHQPWRTAAECIDWSVPVRSIFGRKRPLAEATLRRIAAGVMRFVVKNPRPFIVPVTHTTAGNRAHDSAEPLRTVTTARGGELALVAPSLAPLTHQGADRGHSVEEPMRTITAAHRGETALIAAHLTKFHEGSVGAEVRQPMPTVTANSPHGRPGGSLPLGVVEAKIAPLVLNNMTNNVPRPADEPLVTVLTGGHKFLVAPALTKLYGTSEHGAPVEDPTPTVTAGGQHIAVTAATLVQSGYGERDGQAPRALDVAQPLGTVVAGGAKHAIVSAFMTKHFGGVVGQPLSAPASTITATDHHAVTTVALSPTEHRAEVRAFLLKYYSGSAKPEASTKGRAKGKRKRSKADEAASGNAQGQDIRTPLHTITTRDRFALVTVDGVDYEIVDIGMRMLEPHELWRAQGFPEDLDVLGFNKSKQIELCGNSVCPPVAEAIVRANFSQPINARRAA